jgi:hypothetical protein
MPTVAGGINEERTTVAQERPPTKKTRRPEIDQPPRSAFSDPQQLDYYDRMCARHLAMREQTYTPGDDVQIGQHYGPMMINPEWAWHMHQLGSLARKAGNDPGTYSHADREWVDQVIGYDAKANHVFPTHIDDAISVGVRLEAIVALREGREDELTEDEQLLTRYIREVASGTVDQETWDRMFKRLGHKGLAEYTAFIMLFVMILRMFQAFDLPAPSDEEIARHIQALKDGAVAPDPDFASRFR